MIRVLHIARYTNSMMERKVDLMEEESDLTFLRIRPSRFESLSGRGATELPGSYSTLKVPLIGRSDDPHRALYRTLTFAMASFKPHLIHAEEEPDSLPALQVLWAKRLFRRGAPLILHTWQNVDRPKKRHVMAVIRASLRGSAAVLCANGQAVQLLDGMGYTGLTEVIPQQGVDTRVFKPVDGFRGTKGFTVMYAGRFVREKGLDTLFDAVAGIREPVHLLLVGSGPEQEGIENRIRALKAPHTAEIAAPRGQADLARLYAGADAFVLPSRSTVVWQEQFGRVLAEAMACAVPVVGSDSGAIPEVIGPDGLIFREGDAEDLARCIVRLMGSSAFRVSLAGRGHARATTMYSQENLAVRTARFYRKVMEGGRPA